MTTAVRDRVLFEDHDVELKARIGIADAAQDVRLSRLWLSACSAADTFLANPFDGSRVSSPEEIPPDVIEGVFAFVIAAWVQEGEGDSMAALPAGAVRVKTGSLEQSFSANTGNSPHAIRLGAAVPYWRPWQRQRWR